MRVLIAKPGLDGHDVGAKLLCRALRDAGMEAIYTGLRQTPAAIARAAVDEDVDVVGLSILSGAHFPLCERMLAALRAEGATVPVIVGGAIPARDRAALCALGLAAAFPWGTAPDDIVGFLRALRTSLSANRQDAKSAKTLRTPPSPPHSALRTPHPPLPPVGARTPPSRGEGVSGPGPQHSALSTQHSAGDQPAPYGTQTSNLTPETSHLKPSPPPVVWESGLEIKPVYTAEDRAQADPAALGRPGEFPFTRGIHPLMYRRQPWTMRQYSGFGTAAETHERFLYLLRHGQTGLNVAFDLPTQCGLDSDHPMAAGEVGRVGMAVDTLADMEEAFAGIDLDRVTVSLTINGAAVPIMAMYFALAEQRGFDLATLRGTAQNDILKEFIGRGTWIFPVEPSIRLVGDTIEYCARHVPKYSPVSVCGYHVRESGATPAEEMAYALAIAGAYLDHARGRGLSPDAVAGRLSFNFDIHGNLWEQVAKFRAGRRLWARLLKDRYGVTDEDAMRLRMIAGGGGGGLTVEQPENNIVRGAYYALASALAGTQTMALCSYDEAYTIPSERAARLSLRTMQILMHEVGLSDTVDPLAGSYFIETVTDEMEARIRALLDELDAEGGIVRAVAEGRVQAAVNRRAWERERALRSGAITKVGVNCCREEDEAPPEVEFHPYREEEAQAQIARLQAVRARRDRAAVAATLDRLRDAARTGENVMPAAIAAVRAEATVGEVCDALRAVFGSYREPIRF